MAKKNNERRRSSGTSNWYIIGILAFIALFCYAAAALLSWFGLAAGAFSGIATLFLLIVVIWTAWIWVRGKSRGWRITFLVCLIVIIVIYVLTAWIGPYVWSPFV